MSALALSSFLSFSLSLFLSRALSLSCARSLSVSLSVGLSLFHFSTGCAFTEGNPRFGLNPEEKQWCHFDL